MYQIRDALAAYFAALPLRGQGRKYILQKAARIISYERHRIDQDRTGHRKATIKALKRRGIYITQIRTCLGSNFAL